MCFFTQVRDSISEHVCVRLGVCVSGSIMLQLQNVLAQQVLTYHLMQPKRVQEMECI